MLIDGAPREDTRCSVLLIPNIQAKPVYFVLLHIHEFCLVAISTIFRINSRKTRAAFRKSGGSSSQNLNVHSTILNLPLISNPSALPFKWLLGPIGPEKYGCWPASSSRPPGIRAPLLLLTNASRSKDAVMIDRRPYHSP